MGREHLECNRHCQRLYDARGHSLQQSAEIKRQFRFRDTTHHRTDDKDQQHDRVSSALAQDGNEPGCRYHSSRHRREIAGRKQLGLITPDAKGSHDVGKCDVHRCHRQDHGHRTDHAGHGR